MRSRRLAAAYTEVMLNTPGGIVNDGEPPLPSKLEQFERAFDIYTTDSLNGELNNYSTPEERATLLEAYQEDSVRNEIDAQEAASQSRAFRNYTHASEPHSIDFHVRSQLMHEAWEHFLLPEVRPLDDNELMAIQARISSKAMLLIRINAAFDDGAPRNRHRAIEAYFSQQLTELDAAVAGIEFVRQTRKDAAADLVMLPAPTRFYSAPHSSQRIDFLFVNMALERAHGIRVLPYITSSDSRESLPTVSIIDGLADLGNMNVESASEDGEGVLARPAPGALSASFLLRHNDFGLGSASHTEEFGSREALKRLLKARETAGNFWEERPAMAKDGHIERAAEAIERRLARRILEIN